MFSMTIQDRIYGVVRVIIRVSKVLGLGFERFRAKG